MPAGNSSVEFAKPSKATVSAKATNQGAGSTPALTSNQIQGDTNGTFHANWAGQQAIANIVYQALSPESLARPEIDVQSIDGDGFADVFLVNKNGAGINAYVAGGGTSGLGGFTPLNGLWTNAFDPATTRTSMGDINGDGFADVFLVNKNGAGINAYVARGGTSGLGGFTPLNGRDERLRPRNHPDLHGRHQR